MMDQGHDQPVERRAATTPLERVAAVAGLAFLCLLHFDFWREPDPAARVGWLPLELAWRLAWMVASGAYLWWFTARFWRAERAGR